MEYTTAKEIVDSIYAEEPDMFLGVNQDSMIPKIEQMISLANDIKSVVRWRIIDPFDKANAWLEIEPSEWFFERDSKN
jgi:hypothetical protein